MHFEYNLNAKINKIVDFYHIRLGSIGHDLGKGKCKYRMKLNLYVLVPALCKDCTFVTCVSGEICH